MTKTTQRNKTFSIGTMALVVAVVLFSNGQQQVSADNTISWLPRISSLQLLPVSSFYYQSPSTQEFQGNNNCLSPAPTVYYDSKAPESPLSSVFGSTFRQFTTIQSGPAASPELDLNKSPVDSSEGGKEDTTDPMFVGDDKNDPQFTAFSFPGGGDGRKALGHQRSLVPVDYFSGKTDPDIINLCSSERSPLINFPPPDSSDASSLCPFAFVALSLVASLFLLF